MARDPKIISISPAIQGSEDDRERTSSLPVPLRNVRKEAVAFIKARLSALFDNADDSLFEMADRAASNSEQALFFEAMRAVRLQRHAITTHCCLQLGRNMEALNDSVSSVRAKPPVNFAIDSLSLVQPDELEQTVALDSMVGRVVERNRQGLSHLAIRFNSLVKSPVDETSNPVGPAGLAQIFADALGEMTLDIKVRLIVLKLFERYVFNLIDPFYAAANAELVSAGVLPDLKSITPARRQQSAAMSVPGAMTAAGHVSGDYGAQESNDQQRVLSLFSELIGNWRHASGDAALSRVTGSSAAPLQSGELLGVLAQVPVGELEEGGFTRQDLRIHINQLLQEQRDHQGQRRSLDRIDEDVISLVSMLFDFILDDPQLPAALKAMIGRLQLPILRLAISDKRFFGQASHPARRLLNELARVTMGWNDQDDLRRDQLHVLLDSIVQRLLAETAPQPDMFAAMHGELTSFVNTEKRRSDLLEQRTRDAEEGKARIDAARGEVAARLNALLLGKTLPVFVVDLLRETWSQVMQMTCLREGPDSAAMQAAAEVARKLLVSVQPLGNDDAVEREALSRQVRESVAEGLTLLGIQAEQGAPQLVRLKQLQQSVLLEADPSVRQVEAVPVLEIQDQGNSRGAQEAGNALDPEAAPAPVVTVDSTPQAQRLRIPVIQVREPVLEETVVPANAEITEDVDLAAVAWVEQLHTGGWFEFQLDAHAATQRCKLAAVISFSGKYIFVNRAGMKVAEFAQLDLARHHAAGLIRLLDNNQLFDRALESVIGNLRQLQSGRH